MSLSVAASLRLLGAASILALAASQAVAQTEPGSRPAASAPAEAKAGEKAESDSKKPAKPKPVAPSGYATEAEAKAHCKGGVVWVDEHHFNHYPGSREYGKKPGAFACEQG
jgi:hypothetical protein